MDQERADFADPEPTGRPPASERANAVLVLAAVLYPIGCVLLMGCTWQWFLGNALDRLVFNVTVVPAVAVFTLVLLRLTLVRFRWVAVGLFAVWAAVVALFVGWLITGIYASV